MRILLDPGHGQYGNPYPPQKGYYEGTQMWKLAGYLKAELEGQGFEVSTTRSKLSDNPSVQARGKMAKGHDLFISLHSNAPAVASDTGPTGTVVFYTMSTPHIKPLADAIGKKVSEIMAHKYKGSLVREHPTRKGQDYYGVLRNAIGSGCKAGLLIEHGFHTNPKDSAFLIKDENLKKLAIAEAEIIRNYYGMKEGEIMLSRTLKHGMKGEDVGLIQRLLKNMGYYTGPIDNSFGPGQGFLNAVKAFQQDNGLEPDGSIGAKTRDVIINIMLNPKPDTKKVKELEAEIKRYKSIIAKIENYIKEGVKNA